MKAALRTINDHGAEYTALMFACPGCAEQDHNDGIHILPVNTTAKSPAWEWDGDLEAPTISPSILSHGSGDGVCHSFLKAGVFEFLGDSTHSMAGQNVPMPDLPAWYIEPQ
jgi:hypothetical protein